MNSKITIEIWSDFVCPFCYIGKLELGRAIRKLEMEDQVEITYKTFELDPYAPEPPESKYLDKLQERFGSSEQLAAVIQPLEERGRSLGIHFNFNDLMVQNTFKAHRIAKLAEAQGLADRFQEAAFAAIFEEAMDLSDDNTLIQIGESLGLNRSEIEAVLGDPERYLEPIQTDLELTRPYGIESVPFFLFNHKYSLSGAQPQELFEEVLRAVQSEA